MSVRVKTYSLLWLSEYGKVNNKIVRQYFEKDLKLLLAVYNRISQLMSAADLVEIREAISVLVGRQKMQEHFAPSETGNAELNPQAEEASLQRAQHAGFLGHMP